MTTRSMALRILYDQPLPNVSAASIQVLKTAGAFARRGHDVRIYHPGKPIDVQELSSYYGEAWPDSMTFLASKYTDWLGRMHLRRDINHRFPASQAVVLLGRGAAVQGLLTARRLSPRTIRLYEMHNIQWLRYAQKSSLNAANSGRIVQLREQEIQTIRAVDGLICLTQAVKEAARDLAGRLPPSLILPSGTNLSATESVSKAFDVTYAGKIEARKGVDILVAAMAHLPGRHLAIAGGPKSAVAEIRKHVQNHNLQDRIQIRENIPFSAVSDFLISGKVGVCPNPQGYDAVSDRFTSPMKLLQMLSLGMAVVATDTAPIRAIVQHDHDAWLVPANDPRALAVGIQTLLHNPALALRLGHEAKKTAVRYSWDRRAERLERFVSLLAEPASASSVGSTQTV
mgnify:CR=1 FL=1